MLVLLIGTLPLLLEALFLFTRSPARVSTVTRNPAPVTQSPACVSSYLEPCPCYSEPFALLLRALPVLVLLLGAFFLVTQSPGHVSTVIRSPLPSNSALPMLVLLLGFLPMLLGALSKLLCALPVLVLLLGALCPVTLCHTRVITVTHDPPGTGGFVRRWHGRMINVHPSLLPAFKGAHAHREVIAARVRISGCTVHFVTVSTFSTPAGRASVPGR